MNIKPIDFCKQLADAIVAGKKTLAYKPMPSASMARYLERGIMPAPAWGVIGDQLAVNVPGQVIAPLTLTITAIAVVRLSTDLTDASALAAGMVPRDKRSPRDEFIAQWDTAYGKGLAVATNPPVWRLSFTR